MAVVGNRFYLCRCVHGAELTALSDRDHHWLSSVLKANVINLSCYRLRGELATLVLDVEQLESADALRSPTLIGFDVSEV